MSGNRQLVLLALAVIGAWVVFLPAASATPGDHVQVGRPEQNATAGFPLGLFTGVAMLPAYRAVGRFDGESRNWEGPESRAGTLGGTSTLDWQVTFDRPGSATAMAARALGGLSWPVAEQARFATAAATRWPGSTSASFEAVPPSRGREPRATAVTGWLRGPPAPTGSRSGSR